MNDQPEAFQLAAELERTDSPFRRSDTVALRAAELLRQQWRAIEMERESAIERTRAYGEKVLLVREQQAEIERLKNLLYDQLGELTALRAAHKLRKRLDAFKEGER